MKTFFKRSMYFVGLGFASLLVFSTLFTVLTPPQSVLAAPNNCTDGFFYNANAMAPDGTNGRCDVCPTGYISNAAHTACIDDARSDPQGAPTGDDNDQSSGGSFGNAPGCAGALNSPQGYNCGTIPRGCPGTTQIQGGNPTGTSITCPFIAINNTWTCPVDSCVFPNGTVTRGQPSGGLNNGTASGATDEPDLECAVSWNVLTWALCPIVFMINSALTGLDNAISSLLSVEQNVIFNLTNPDGSNNTTGTAYYTAWQSFRSIALGILIAGALIMIVGQALGFELLDAYTIKKILPRLIVALIGIALSWDIMKFFVGFTNDLGETVRGLIYLPFKGMDDAVLNGGGTTIVALLLSGGLFAFGIMGLLSFGLTALLGLFIAFMVLILRQLIIVVLILFSPIAIACYILPNTQSVWKLWYESFTKALMMFPIIMAFLAVGRVMAVTSTQAGATAVGEVVGLIAYVLPYFLIPLTFRFAGGALRTLGGFVNDKGRGGFDRLKKYRGGQVEKNMHNAKEGKRFSNTSAIGRRVNPIIGAVASAPSAGIMPGKMRSRYNAAKSAHTYDAAEEIRTKNADFLAGAQDDRLLKATQHGVGREGIKKYLSETLPADQRITNPADLDTAVGIVERMQNSGSRDAVNAAVAIQRFATGTGYNDANGKFDADEAMASIAAAGHGDRALQGRLLGTAKGVAGQAGQTSFGGASYGALNTQLERKIKGETVDGSALALNAFMGTDAATASRGRTLHVEAMTSAVVQRIAGIQAGTAKDVKPGELGQLVSQLENFRDTAGMYGAPDRQVVVNQQIVATQPAQTQLRVETIQHINELNNTAATAIYDPATRQRINGPQPSANVQQQQAFRGRRAADPDDPRAKQD